MQILLAYNQIPTLLLRSKREKFLSSRKGQTTNQLMAAIMMEAASIRVRHSEDRELE